MRFNFSTGPGELRLAQVDVFGHLANVSIWMGAPVQAAESRYLLQFEDTWGQKSDREKCEDAVRVAITNSLEGLADPDLIELIIDQEHERWGGRLDALA